MNSHITFRSKRTWVVPAVLIVFTISGCGGGGKRTGGGVVEGKVTYKGQPVPSGTVRFFSLGADSDATSVPIGADGTYHASGVPLGKVSITVETPPPGPTAEQAEKNPFMKRKGFHGSTEKTVTIPGKYGRSATSGLSLTVAEGQQPFDIVLN